MNHSLPALLTGLASVLLSLAQPALAEDGYALWLRYAPLAAERRAAVAPHVRAIVAPASPSAVTRSAVAELQRGLGSLLGEPVPFTERIEPGSVIVGIPSELPDRLDPSIGELTQELGDEGYALRHTVVDGKPVILLTALSDRGLLYGAFALLRHIESGTELDRLQDSDLPRLRLRLLNHWDNIDRSVERGYAGQSIWDWWRDRKSVV